MIDISTLTIFSARKKLDSKEFSVVELVKTYLDEINRKNKDINAYLEIYNDVLEQAKMADQAITRGEIFPMTGIPIAVKDNILIEGKTATSGSKILKGFVAPYDATVIKKLKSQGYSYDSIEKAMLQAVKEGVDEPASIGDANEMPTFPEPPGTAQKKSNEAEESIIKIGIKIFTKG